MAKNFKLLSLFSVLILLLFTAPLSHARPIQVGFNFSFRDYNNFNFTTRSEGIIEGYDLYPSAGVELFLLFPILENVDIEIAAEDILPIQLRMPGEPPEDVIGFLPIYLNGILNWGKIGPIYPYFGAGINVTNIKEKFFGEEYTQGAGYQFFMGASFGGGWRGEIGYAFLNSTAENNITRKLLGAFSRTIYFKFGYALSI